MLLARVVGNVVSTQKHSKFHGAKLLLVQPLTVNDEPRGPVLLAVDGVGAEAADEDGDAGLGHGKALLAVCTGRSPS